MAGFTANFGISKAGLSTVKWAYLDNLVQIIGVWAAVAGELQSDTGIYYMNDVPPSNAMWLAFRSDETEYKLYLILGLQEKGFVFYFGEIHTGKSISYQFFTDVNVPTGPVQTADIVEFEGSGIYLPKGVVIPSNAVYIKIWTDDVPPIYIAGAIDFDLTIYTQVPRTGPIAEEVVT